MTGSPPDDHTEEDRERMRAVLLSLPKPTLRVFLANRVHGLSYCRIAKRYRMPLWQVRRHMLRAIRHIDRYRDGMPPG
jgi:RNA polymerase sigma-70 factor (ECF subfamily)